MTKISSDWTWYHTHLCPRIWFVIPGVSLAFSLGDMLIKQRLPLDRDSLMFLFVPLVMIVFGCRFFHVLFWDVVEEVHDNEHEIVVRNKGQEERVPLANIKNIDSNRFMSPEKITLYLRNPTQWGKELSFLPPPRPRTLSFWSLRGPHPIASDLIDRVDEARSPVG